MDAKTEHDVFISYSSADAAWAQAVLEALEELGVRCWIAPRDVIGGENWSGAIVAAIHGCRLMVLIFSRQSNESPEVTRELVQAAERGVHILPLRVDEVQPSNDKAYYLSGAHWRTVLGGPTEENLAQLTNDVRRLIDIPATSSGPVRVRRPKVGPARSRSQRWVVAAVVVTAALPLIAWRITVYAHDRKPQELKKNPPSVPVEPGPKPASEREPPIVLPPPEEKKQPTDDVEKPSDDRLERESWSRAPARIRELCEHVGTEWTNTAGRSLPTSVRHRATGIEFVLVPAGRFVLGADPSAGDTESDEYPTREVQLGPFYIARYETTAAQFSAGSDASNEPVVDVTQQQAEAWCSERGLALPTEAQWEYAASGPKNSKYPWGDTWEAGHCNSIGTGDGFRELAPVGGFKQNGACWCGAEDLAGNVAEWCRGFYSPSYADLNDSVDATPLTQDSFRVARGGSWGDRPINLRTSDRRRYEPRKRDGLVGFRCVFEP